ncbi:unnamed protein product [Protopolystoma xenopodis]|uniref:Uncharacterized protein n=1 Tax=Protopolystoma xenopodis TaxID=117903 RepID=A0A448WV88_9PLAT|nr:unnamed protein product [Protopolystoma xenopodis]
MEFSVPYCKTNTRWSPSSCKSDQTQRPNDTVATTARPGAARSFVPGQSGRVDGRSSGASMGGEKVQTEHGVTARVSSGAGSALASSAVTGAKAGLPGASKPADVEIDDFILSGIMDLGGSRGDGRGNEANEMGAGASGAGRYGHQSTGQTEERDQLVENMRRSSKKFGSLAGGTEIEVKRSRIFVAQYRHYS